jgi:hypothetical protein
MGDQPDLDRELLRRWAETWERVGRELEAIRRREIESVDTQEAIRQIFGSGPLIDNAPPRTTSGLVEQQKWFARLRAAKREQ